MVMHDLGSGGPEYGDQVMVGIVDQEDSLSTAKQFESDHSVAETVVRAAAGLAYVGLRGVIEVASAIQHLRGVNNQY